VLDRAALEALARELVQASLGSADMIEQLAALGTARRDVVLRINPGFGHGHHAKVTTGGEASKHGIWHAELPQAARRAERAGLEVSGLHVHVGSGVEVAQLQRAIEPLVEHGHTLFGATLDSISVGGGLPIPYREGDARAELQSLFAHWERGWVELESRLRRPLRFEVEPGRFLVAEAGVLLTEARALKQSGSLEYVLVDAGFNNLVRPALYGAYHEISVVGRDGEPRVPLVVAGPLCESSDVFTVDSDGAPQPRELPRPAVGDLLCIHDAGAYAASMASNYNSQLLAAEILVHNGAARVVRARQSLEDLLRPELP
jgi:diaminopimelate decarboxylase